MSEDRVYRTKLNADDISDSVGELVQAMVPRFQKVLKVDLVGNLHGKMTRVSFDASLTSRRFKVEVLDRGRVDSLGFSYSKHEDETLVALDDEHEGSVLGDVARFLEFITEEDWMKNIDCELIEVIPMQRRRDHDI